MKKSKIAMPPPVLNTPAMLEAIHKGGSVGTRTPITEHLETAATPPPAAEDKLKSFTFKIYESELSQIRSIQDQLPKRDRISIHDFVVAAVKEKIARGRKKSSE